MQQMEQASRRIQDIVSVIDGLAFQTNILALNAAVEAARAGEEGRGFAVVASEVRALALRSFTAASQIKTLIGESVTHMQAGVQQVRHAGESMQHIVSTIGQVSSTLSKIAIASQQEAGSIAQVHHTSPAWIPTCTTASPACRTPTPPHAPWATMPCSWKMR